MPILPVTQCVRAHVHQKAMAVVNVSLVEDFSGRNFYKLNPKVNSTP